VIQNHLEGLNPEQMAAAAAMGHCLVVAAPGSGKTKMLASKAAHLLAMGASVTAVTFTKDSALELRARILKQAGEGYLEQLLVGTFHSIDLLMAFPKLTKTPMGRMILAQSKSALTSPWKIVREGVRRDAVQRAMDASGLDLKEIADGTALIEALKSGQRKPADDAEEILVEAYKEILAKQGVIDFQDILLNTNRGMEEGFITPLKTDYLLLDEFQDTDKAQFDWVIHHAKAGSKITAVGDDDQSIYGFRNALGYVGMQKFELSLSAEKIILGMNYRSHGEILVPANELIQYNGENRVPKALVSFRGNGGQAYWEKFSRDAEPLACISEIQKSLKQGQTVGVLARTNKRLDDIEAQLIRAQIPYSRPAGDSILNSRETQLMLATLTLLVKETARDADQLLSWCGVDEDDLKSLHAALGPQIFKAIEKGGRNALNNVALKDAAKTILRGIAKRLVEWAVYVQTDCADFVITRASELLIEHTPDKRAKMILPIVADIFRKPTGKSASTGSLAQKVDEITKMISRPVDTAPDPSVSVSLMTAHGSKGLEYDMVWILGADDGVFPSKDGSIQEERRLFYVAMTRARKILWISSVSSAVSEFVLNSCVPRIDSNYFLAFTSGGQSTNSASV
jgi:DNA helicase II / ATP-dependent DNA helicase PcrA